MVTLASLNVKGLREPIKGRPVFWWLWQKTANLIVLQGTHSDKASERVSINEWGGGILRSLIVLTAVGGCNSCKEK